MEHLRESLIAAALAAVMAATASAQQEPPRQQRPTRYPPQYPQIIGTDKPAEQPQEPAPAAVEMTSRQMDLLVGAVQSLAGEVRQMTHEMRLLNVRQQAQIDLLRLTRYDMRIEIYERAHNATAEQLVQLDAQVEELQRMMTPESLALQAQQVGTLNREATMQQMKQDHEGRLRAIQTQREQLRQREAELKTQLETARAAYSDAEQRIQQAEETLRQMDAPAPTAPERKP